MQWSSPDGRGGCEPRRRDALDRCVCHQHRRLRQRGDAHHAVRPPGRPEQHRDGIGAQRPVESHDGRESVVEREQHAIAAAHVRGTQDLGRAVGEAVELGIAERALAQHQGRMAAAGRGVLAERSVGQEGVRARIAADERGGHDVGSRKGVEDVKDGIIVSRC